MPPTTGSSPKPVKIVSTGPNEMPNTLAWKPRKTVLTRDPARATETSAASRPSGLMTAVTRPTNSREVLARASGPAVAITAVVGEPERETWAQGGGKGVRGATTQNDNPGG